MQEKIRDLCFITGSRSDYDLLYHLISKAKNNNNFKVKLIATGSHFDKRFGYSYKNILKDNLKIDSRIKLSLNNFDPLSISKYVSENLVKISKVLKKYKPDLVIILGDRYEIMSVAISCLISNIPLAHLSGGEVTHGSIDDSIRHSITKMSDLHFVSNTKYKKRVIQLGEEPNTVFDVGGLYIDNVKKTKILNKKLIEKKLRFNFLKKNYLVTFHPETNSIHNTIDNFKFILKCLKKIKNSLIIFTYPNADTHNDKIKFLIDNFVKQNQNSVKFKNLGRVKYLSVLSNVDCLIGNSSSGILEAPALGVPTLNLGNRQIGRVSAKSVLNCNYNEDQFFKLLNKINTKTFKSKIQTMTNPYGNGKSSERILKIINSLTKIEKIKKFYDL